MVGRGKCPLLLKFILKIVILVWSSLNGLASSLSDNFLLAPKSSVSDEKGENGSGEAFNTSSVIHGNLLSALVLSRNQWLISHVNGDLFFEKVSELLNFLSNKGFSSSAAIDFLHVSLNKSNNKAKIKERGDEAFVSLLHDIQESIINLKENTDPFQGMSEMINKSV